MTKNPIHTSDLVTDPSNANKGTQRGRGMLEDSIRQLGLGRSIVLDKNGVIIAGNKTAEVAVELGLEDLQVVHSDGKKLVAVMRDDLDLETDPEARRLAVADNRVGEISLEWDADQLQAMLEDDANALEGLFDKSELDTLLAGLKEPAEDPGARVDEAAELQEKWQTERGQLWEIPSLSTPGKAHRLLCGDSTSAEDVARLMGGEKAGMGFHDPPYGIAFQSNGRTATLKFERLQSDDRVDGRWIPLATQVLQDDGAMYICTRWDVYPEWRLIIEIEPQIAVKNLIVWDKVDWSSGDLEGDYSPRHEFIFYCVKGRHILRGHRESNIWAFGALNKQGYLHPTQKKPELPAFAISKSSDPGGIVADWFLGSGTTMIAAEQTGRLCYGMEIEPKYIAVSLQRLSDMGLEPRLVVS